MPTPNKFNDPYWTNLASSTEQRLGLPGGLLNAVLTKGERSNADQVSSKGAKTPFQVTPETRNLVLKKYGVDAYLSPENAAEAGGLLLRESLARNKGNKALAVAEYHGGVDRNNWGPITKAYVKRVLGPDANSGKPSQPQSTFDRLNQQQQESQGKPSIAKRLEAYKNGTMPEEEAAQFEAGINSGKILLPKGTIKQDTGPMELPPGVMEAYHSGDMPRKDMIQLETDVKNGIVKLPQGQSIGETQPLSTIGKVADFFTGSERSTKEIESLPDWTNFAEGSGGALTGAGVSTGIGTTFTSPEETVKVIQANYPGTTVRQDAKGNYILRNPDNGQEYAIKPGMRPSDIPRVLAGFLSATPAAKATTITGSALASAGTQAAVEASQAATGGEFNTGEVITAGTFGGAVPLALRIGRAVRPGVTTAATPATQATQAVEGAALKAEQAPKPAMDVPAVEPTPTAAAPITEQEYKSLGEVIKKASSNSIGSEKAKAKLAEMAKINPEAKAAADRLGIELPADVLSENQMIREAAGLTRSVAGSEASAAWRDTVTKASEKADEVMASIEATPDIARVSESVKSSLNATRNDLEKEAKAIYETVNKQVPKTSTVKLQNLKKTMDEIVDELGGVAALSKEERALYKMANDPNATYGWLARARGIVGDAIGGKNQAYPKADLAGLKRMYAAMAQDQLDNVAALGGKDLRDQLRGANQLYAKKAALEKRIINAYGKETEGSISSLMRRAIDAGAKGDIAPLNKLLKAVPKEMQKDVVSSALMAATRAKGGVTSGGFGFAEFTKAYQGLRSNSPVYAKIADVIGDDGQKMLKDLYTVSKKITDARANVLTTGKANQALENAITADGLINKVLSTSLGKAAATGAGAVGGGPMGAVAGSAVSNLIASGKGDAMKRAGELFNSPEFQKMAIEASTKASVSNDTIKKVALSKAFSQFAAAVKIPRELSAREQWLLQALQAGNTMNKSEDKKGKL